MTAITTKYNNLKLEYQSLVMRWIAQRRFDPVGYLTTDHHVYVRQSLIYICFLDNLPFPLFLKEVLLCVVTEPCTDNLRKYARNPRCWSTLPLLALVGRSLPREYASLGCERPSSLSYRLINWTGMRTLGQKKCIRPRIMVAHFLTFPRT